MKPDKPLRLYRYRPLGISESRDRQEFASIRDAYLWFSSFSDLNDPAELVDFKIAPPDPALVASLEALVPGLGKIPHAQARYAKHRATKLVPKDSSAVCCFTEVPSNQAMWASYANGFKGICIEYDVARLLSLLDVSFGNRLSKVSYRVDRTLTSADYIGSQDETAGYQSFSTKHTDWQHEREWRLVQKGTYGASYHTANAISAVVLGPRISEEHEKAFIDIARTRAFEVRRAKFEGHILDIREVKIERATKPQTLCDMSDAAKEDRVGLLAKGVDENSLDGAIKKLRAEPGASVLSYLSLHGDTGTSLYAHLCFSLPDKSEKPQVIRLDVKGGIVSEQFEYVWE